MNNTSPLLNSNKKNTFPVTAHFQGTARNGKACKDCKYCEQVKGSYQACRKAAQLKNQPLKSERNLQFFLACKYFVGADK